MLKDIRWFYVPKIENTYDYITQKSIDRSKEIYGKPLPNIVSERLQWELDAIKKHQHEIYFHIAEKLASESHKHGYIILACNNWGASLMAYLLGITDINPLPFHNICDNCGYVEFVHTVNVHDCPKCGKELRADGYDLAVETLLADGSKVPNIQLCFPAEFCNQAGPALQEMFPDDKIVVRDSKAQNVKCYYIVPKHIQIDDSDSIENLNEHFVCVSIIVDPKITLLNELKHRIGMSIEYDVCSSLESMRNETAIFADDIIRELTSHGVPAFIAYRFMRAVKRGALKPGARYDGWVDTLGEYGIPSGYVASLAEITYLPTGADAATNTKIERALALYEKHYPQEFMEACKKYGLL